MRRHELVLCALLLSACGAYLAPQAGAAIVPNPDSTLIVRWEPCEPDTGVTVIVDRHERVGDGKIDVGCALGEQENGLAALHNAGFATEGVGGGYSFVCRINGQPTFAEDPCEKTPGGCCYWSYWHGKPGGLWGYSGYGAADPHTRASVNSVEGWGFGGGQPRVYPMDGSGPSSFTLPPPQESSVAPAASARKWLLGAAVGTAELAQTPGSGVAVIDEEALIEAIALSRADVDPTDLAPIASLFEKPWESNGFEYSRLLGYANGSGIDPESPEFPLYGDARDYALAIVGLAALGKDPTDFLGHDLRADLIAKIDDANGKIVNKHSGGPLTKSAELFQTMPTIWGLALTGSLSAKAGKTLELMLDAQDPISGAFGSGAPVFPIETLVAARDAGAAGLSEPIEKAADYLESFQEEDGGIRRALESGPASGPTFEATAAGAVALALAGRKPAAQKAAKWASRYQLTAEYVGTPDPVTGDPAPAEPLIGAFLSDEGLMRNATVNGIPPLQGSGGLYSPARIPTAEALEALTMAGPYGPYYASLDEGSLWFGKQTVGTRGKAVIATLTNEDKRQFSIAFIDVTGGQPGDFILDSSDCLGATLAAGESCDLVAQFAPTATGTREAVARIAVNATNQTFELSLGGTGFPAPVVKPNPNDDPGSGPQPVTAPGADSILAAKTSQAKGRTVKIAQLSCPAGASCALKLAKRVRVKIAGKLYWAQVLAPTTLEAQGAASVRLRLSGPALAALRLAGHALVKLKVAIATEGGAVSQTVKVRIEPRGKASTSRMRSQRCTCFPFT